ATTTATNAASAIAKQRIQRIRTIVDRESLSALSPGLAHAPQRGTPPARVFGKCPSTEVMPKPGQCDDLGGMARFTTTRFVLGAYVIFAVAPFGRAALHSWFWQGQHSTAPVATALYLAVVVALVAWR